MAEHPDFEHAGLTNETEIFRCPTHESGRAEEELLHVRKQHPEWNAKIVVRQGRAALDAEEAQAVSFLKNLFERTLLVFAERGWVSLKPPEAFKSPAPEGGRGGDAQYDRGVSDKGEVFFAQVTNAGLDAAERIIAGDPYWSQGSFSSLEGQTAEIKAAAVTRNPWAHRLYLDEGGR